MVAQTVYARRKRNTGPGFGLLEQAIVIFFASLLFTNEAHNRMESGPVCSTVCLIGADGTFGSIHGECPERQRQET